MNVASDAAGSLYDPPHIRHTQKSVVPECMDASDCLTIGAVIVTKIINPSICHSLIQIR